MTIAGIDMTLLDLSAFFWFAMATTIIRREHPSRSLTIIDGESD